MSLNHSPHVKHQDLDIIM